MSRFIVPRLAALLAFCLVTVIGTRAQESPDTAKVWSYGEIKWQTDKTLPSVQSAPLWGNAASGEHECSESFQLAMRRPCTSTRRWSELS
jgi:hypothetical protein